jgi:hypothetical protein
MSRVMNAKVPSPFRNDKAPVDGETLAMLAAIFERAIAASHREKLLDRVRDVERRLSEVDHVLTSCETCCVMNGLADKIRAVHASVADLQSSLDEPTMRDRHTRRPWASADAKPSPSINSRPG